MLFPDVLFILITGGIFFEMGVLCFYAVAIFGVAYRWPKTAAAVFAALICDLYEGSPSVAKD